MKSKTKKRITLASLAIASVLTLGGVAAMQGSIRGGAETIEPGSKGPIDLYVISGQSNAVGTDTFISNVKDDWATKYDTANYSSKVAYWGRVYNSDQDPLYMNFDNTVKFGMGYTSAAFGAEVGMSKILGEKRGDRNAVIVKSAKGASAIAGDGNNTWRDDGVLWQNWQNDVTEVVQHYLAEGYTVNLAGTFWMQGEQDSFYEENINLYADRLTHLINNMKGVYEDLELGNATTAPFVIGKISQTYANANGTHAENNTRIREAQESVAKAMAQENVVTIDTPDISVPAEVSEHHFSANQMLEIGENVANLMLEKSALTMKEGASVRINEPTGIRFGATLSSDKYAEIIENGAYNEGYSVGMIVVPKTYFDEFNAQTANPDYYSYFSTVKGKMIDLPFEPDQFKYNKQTGDYDFHGAITDIFEVNFALDFQAVAYVKKGDTYSYSNVSDARNVQYVAKAAIEAGKLNADQMNSLNTAYALGGYTVLNVIVPTQEEPLSVYVAKAQSSVTGADVAQLIYSRYGLKVSADGFTKDGAAATAFENNGTYTATIKPTVTVKFADGTSQQFETVYGEDFTIPADTSTIFAAEHDCTLTTDELENLTDDITVTYKVKEELLRTEATGFSANFGESGWTLQSKDNYPAAVIMQGASKTHYVKYTVNKPANARSEEFGMYVSDGEKSFTLCFWVQTTDAGKNRVLNNGYNCFYNWAAFYTMSPGESIAVDKLFSTDATTLTFEMFLMDNTIYYYVDGVLITSGDLASEKFLEANRLDPSKDYTVGFATYQGGEGDRNTYTGFEHLTGNAVLAKYNESANVNINVTDGLTAEKTNDANNDIKLSVTATKAFNSYISGSERVQGKSFIVETNIAVANINGNNAYGVSVWYSSGHVLTLGFSPRGRVEKREDGTYKSGEGLYVHYLHDGAHKNHYLTENTDAKAVGDNYINEEYLHLQVFYNASTQKYYVYGNNVLFGEFSTSGLTVSSQTELGIGNWGEVQKLGFGAELKDGSKTAEFSSWKFVTEGESEYDAFVAEKNFLKNVTLQVENETLGTATLSGVTNGKVLIGSTVTVNLETENVALVTVNGETQSFKGNSVYTFIVEKDTNIVVSFVEGTTYSVALDESIDVSKLSVTMNGNSVELLKTAEGYTVNVSENSKLTFKYEGYHPVTISPADGKYTVPAFTLLGVDISYSGGAAPTVENTDNGIKVSAITGTVQGYIEGSEQVQGKSFTFETDVAVSSINGNNTYGISIRYSSGNVLTLGLSARGRVETPSQYKLHVHWSRNGGNVVNNLDTNNTAAVNVGDTYRQQEYLHVKVVYNALTNKYSIYGNGVLFGEYLASTLGVRDWGEVEKIGIGTKLENGSKTAEFKDWKYEVTSD